MPTYAPPDAGVRVIVPVKRLAGAKSRLAPALGPAQRRALVLAMLRDTVRAAAAAPGVAGVWVVTPDASAAAAAARAGARTLPEPPGPAAGLNAVLTRSAAAVRSGAPACPLLFLQADLPALRPGELADALAAARTAGGRHAFVADAAGVGTTALFVPAAAAVPRLRFGPASAALHAGAGAAALTGAWPGLRSDVDTAADLARAARLGTGPATDAVLRTLRTAAADTP